MPSLFLSKSHLVELVLRQAERIAELETRLGEMERRFEELERRALRGAAPFARPESKRARSPKRPGRKGGHEGVFPRPAAGGGGQLQDRSTAHALPAFRARTDKPFIINLYIDRAEPYVAKPTHEAALKTALAPAHVELEAGDVPDPSDLFGKFDSQIAVVLEERVPVFSSHFGAPDPGVMRALKANGTKVISTATTVHEARKLVSAGVDAIIAQGSEAGGHRGTFAAPAGHPEIGTLTLGIAAIRQRRRCHSLALAP